MYIIVVVVVITLFAFTYLEGRRDGYTEGIRDGVNEGRDQILKEDIARVEAQHKRLDVQLSNIDLQIIKDTDNLKSMIREMNNAE
jgi:hypothetical protein